MMPNVYVNGKEQCIAPITLFLSRKQVDAIARYPTKAIWRCNMTWISHVWKYIYTTWFGLPYAFYDRMGECIERHCPLNRIDFPERRKYLEDAIIQDIEPDENGNVHILSAFPGAFLMGEIILAIRIMQKLCPGTSLHFHLRYQFTSLLNKAEESMATFRQFHVCFFSAARAYDINAHLYYEHTSHLDLPKHTLIFAVDPGTNFDHDILPALKDICKLVPLTHKNAFVLAYRNVMVTRASRIREIERLMNNIFKDTDKAQLI